MNDSNMKNGTMTINKQEIKKAKKIVLSNNNFSISFLQRTLQVGYNRAAVVMDIIKKSIIRKERGNMKLFSKKGKKIRCI